jgi:hypothetical protein
MDGRTLVRVVWVDTVGWRAGWADADAVAGLEPITCETVGWLVRETKDAITVTDTIASNGHCQAPQAIPRCCIRRIDRVDFERRGAAHVKRS